MLIPTTVHQKKALKMADCVKNNVNNSLPSGNRESLTKSHNNFFSGLFLRKETSRKIGFFHSTQRAWGREREKERKRERKERERERENDCPYTHHLILFLLFNHDEIEKLRFFIF